MYYMWEEVVWWGGVDLKNTYKEQRYVFILNAKTNMHKVLYDIIRLLWIHIKMRIQ